jgi:hypothetical protein
VDLGQAADELLAGLLVAAKRQRRILLGQAAERGAHLLLVPLGLRRDREAHHRLRELERRHLDPLVGGDEQIAGHHVLQLGDGADVPGDEGGLGRVLLALEDEQLTDALLSPGARIDEVGVGLDLARQDAEHVDPPGERVGDRLEDERGRAVRGHLELERLLGRRGNPLDEEVEQPGGAEVLGGGAAPDREEHVGHHGVLKGRRELVPRDLALVEVALHERFVGLDDRVDELLAVVRGLGSDLVRDLDRISLLPAFGREIGLHVKEVDDALEVVLMADRDVDRDAAVGELGAKLLENRQEVRALAVGHVHEHEAREAELLAAGPEPVRLHFDAVDAVQDEERSLDHAQRRERVRLEARIAWRVDEIDLPVLPFDVAERGGQGHLALLLVLVPVGDRRALLDRAEPVRGASLKEECLDQ